MSELGPFWALNDRELRDLKFAAEQSGLTGAVHAIQQMQEIRKPEPVTIQPVTPPPAEQQQAALEEVLKQQLKRRRFQLVRARRNRP
jgi:hypothetical protein